MSEMKKREHEQHLISRTQRNFDSTIQHHLYGLECDIGYDKDALKKIHDITLSILSKSLDCSEEIILEIKEIIKIVEKRF